MTRTQSHPARPVLRRRAFLGGAAAVVALMPLPLAATALAPEVASARQAILDGRAPVEGGISVEVPEVAENGAQVPLRIHVDSPMTAADHVQTIHVLATANPRPGIATFRLTPHLGRAEVFTRIRLAESQDILVLAELSDGSLRQLAARVTVAAGGCAT